MTSTSLRPPLTGVVTYAPGIIVYGNETDDYYYDYIDLDSMPEFVRNMTLNSAALDPDERVHLHSEWRGISAELWLYLAPLIFCIGILGNALILIIMTRRNFKGTTSCVYLSVLAVFDSLVLVTGMIPEWLSAREFLIFKELSPVTCRIEKFVGYSVADVAVWTLAVFTVDRAVAVVLPFKKAAVSTPRRAAILCATLVITACTKNLHVMWTRGPVYETAADGDTHLIKNCGRPEPHLYFEAYIRPWIVFSLVICMPFVAILVSNIMLVYTLLKSRRIQLTHSAPQQERQYRQLTLMCMAASMSFLVLMTPSIFLLIGKPYWKTSRHYLVAKAINNQLTYVNHSINFFLYCVTGKRFRHELYSITCIPKLCSRLGLEDTDSSTPMVRRNLVTTPTMAHRAMPLVEVATRL